MAWSLDALQRLLLLGARDILGVPVIDIEDIQNPMKYMLTSLLIVERTPVVREVFAVADHHIDGLHTECTAIRFFNERRKIVIREDNVIHEILDGEWRFAFVFDLLLINVETANDQRLLN